MKAPGKISAVHKLHKKESREQPKIRLWLDSYDDLFSDFDPRPYSKRTLSDDFISQVRKVSREESGKNFALELLLPAPGRNERHEKMIAQRLPEFFTKNYQQLVTERKQFRMKGLKFAGFGILLMAWVVIFPTRIPPNFMFIYFLSFLNLPAGSFFGADLISCWTIPEK